MSSGEARVSFEDTNARWMKALEDLQARARSDESLAEAVHCMEWAITARLDDYTIGFRKGYAEAQKAAEMAVKRVAR